MLNKDPYLDEREEHYLKDQIERIGKMFAEKDAEIERLRSTLKAKENYIKYIKNGGLTKELENKKIDLKVYREHNIELLENKAYMENAMVHLREQNDKLSKRCKTYERKLNKNDRKIGGALGNHLAMSHPMATMQEDKPKRRNIVNILGTQYTIEERVFEDDTVGRVDIIERKIYFSPLMKSDIHYKQTILHEIVHAMCFEFGVEDWDDEQRACLMEKMLYHLLKDNDINALFH